MEVYPNFFEVFEYYCDEVNNTTISRLYPLVPIGLGTPLVEGLTSYITRLAELIAHRMCSNKKQFCGHGAEASGIGSLELE